MLDEAFGVSAPSERSAAGGPDMLPALIGHCHAEPVFLAAREAGIDLRGFNFWHAPQPAIEADRSAFHPEIASALAGGLVVSAVGGGVHTVLGLLRHPVAFDFELPERPDLTPDPDVMLLPFSAVRGMIAEHLAEYFDIIALVRKTATGAVFHIEAPPPPEDNKRIHGDVSWMFYPSFTQEVSPPPLRYKFWRLASRLTDAFCEANGIGTIPCPAAAIDERGYLRPEYYYDATHVNAAYGKLVLAQILALR